jgi:trans-aconitate methyltransferase
MYGRLADWFHLLTPPSDYEDEAAEVIELLRARASPPLQTALELGSGGGNLASHLGRVMTMTLTDASPRMLELSRTINAQSEHIAADMRTLRLGRTFDAVVIHDAITYLTSTEDLHAALETAFVHLRPGGAGIFMPDFVRDTYRLRTDHGGEDGDGRALRYLEWDRPPEPDGHTVRTDYVIVTRDESGRVEVHHDVHTLGLFPRAIWLELLEDVGFEAGRVVGAEGLDIFLGVRPVTGDAPGAGSG